MICVLVLPVAVSADGVTSVQAVLDIPNNHSFFRVKPKRDGSPTLRSKTTEQWVYIREFNGCSAQKNCESIRMVGQFGGKPVDPSRVANWVKLNPTYAAVSDSKGSTEFKLASPVLLSDISATELDPIFAAWNKDVNAFGDSVVFGK